MSRPTVILWQNRYARTGIGALGANPRITMHFTPASVSWMNLAEIFFGIITRQAIRRGTFTSVKELINAADEILTKALPSQKTSNTRH